MTLSIVNSASGTRGSNVFAEPTQFEDPDGLAADAAHQWHVALQPPAVAHESVARDGAA
jgi:hypothetical protein